MKKRGGGGGMGRDKRDSGCVCEREEGNVGAGGKRYRELDKCSSNTAAKL